MDLGRGLLRCLCVLSCAVTLLVGVPAIADDWDDDESGVFSETGNYLSMGWNYAVADEDGTIGDLGGRKGGQQVAGSIDETEGLNIICIGVSQGLNLIQPEMKIIRKMVKQDKMPEPIEVASVASSSVQRLRTIEPYLLPPLIQFETINASDYVPSANQDQEKMEDPNQ